MSTHTFSLPVGAVLSRAARGLAAGDSAEDARQLPGLQASWNLGVGSPELVSLLFMALSPGLTRVLGTQ